MNKLLKNKEKARSVADPTRDKILAAARKVFVKKGFAGASMAAIAKEASVPKSLLFHHFENKQTLWKLVKQNIVSTVVDDSFTFNTDNGLLAFLTQIVSLRFKAYAENPELPRLITWQMLEDDQAELSGTTRPAISPETWKDSIILLQKQGYMRSDMTPDMIILLIASSVSAIFMTNMNNHSYEFEYLKNYEQKIIDCLYKALKT